MPGYTSAWTAGFVTAYSCSLMKLDGGGFRGISAKFLCQPLGHDRSRAAWLGRIWSSLMLVLG